MESFSGRERVTFEVLRCRLVEQVKQRINNGEFTERGLARILGISQSQAHNVLKGARRLQMELADRILAKLGLSATDLLREGELDAALRLKIAEWDRQLAEADQTGIEEIDLTSLITPRKPIVRSEGTKKIADKKAS